MTYPALPIDETLPDLARALAQVACAVVQAPPGAGKTTRIPLSLLDHLQGRILMLEPRRLAARAAAMQMARLTSTEPGALVGFRVRGECNLRPGARIEVVTEGILTRMIQDDPELPGVGAVIFDEFHERSLQADLGLALVLDIRDTLRPDLALVVMSATLDAAPVAALMGDAPILTSEGRSFPVETRWLDRPRPKGLRVEQGVANLILDALDAEQGSILAFLPGEGEIRRVAALLEGRLPAQTSLNPLYGALPLAQQQAAIAPARDGRKVVLATAIAETSLTIEGVRVVVDSGLARRARFDPGTGMSRLVTERVTRAEATQRQGRAGRTEPGVCYRLWARVEEGALSAFAPPEIVRADLAGFALEQAAWGGGSLRLLTPPPEGALTEAQALLRALGALEADNKITAHGRAMAALPVHPRLAHMLLVAGRDAAPLAALLSERDALPRGVVDLTPRLRALRDGQGLDPALRARLKTESKRLSALAPRSTGTPQDWAEMAALAYPDRIGLRRPGDAPRYLLSSGTGVAMAPGDTLGNAPMIVVLDTDGAQPEAQVRAALPLDRRALPDLFPDQITQRHLCQWSRRTGRIEARVQECLNALVLSDQPWPNAPLEARVRAACDGLRDLGLPWSNAARRFAARVQLLRGQGVDLPDMSDGALLDSAEDWLAPWLGQARTADDLRALDLLPGLRSRLDYAQTQTLDHLAPAHFTTPLGNKVPIDYGDEVPEISLRLQELFGVTAHPCIGPAHSPLRLVLLSPARRPIQVTMDLPGFWATSYADVRRDMRGQYPKHPWPEDPRQAAPTLRAKPRAT
ncbi:MAG: ATP-dependent helicase HrpB [Roseinatronobacter sp.]